MNSHQIIEVDVDLSLGDLYKASVGTTAHFLRYIIGTLAILSALSLLFFIYGSLDMPWGNVTESINLWLLPVLVGGVLPILLLLPIVPYFRARQVLRAEGAKAKRRYVFSQEGFKVESPLASANVNWAACRQVRETRRYFLLYAAPGFASVVPKRCFASDSLLVAFRSLVREQVKKFKLRK
jgi:hypothetical protein